MSSQVKGKIVKVLDAKPLLNLYRTKRISFKKIQLKELSEQLAGDLSRLHFAGRTLTLKIKLDTFEVLSRSITPAVLGHRLLSSAEDLYKHAKLLLEREIENRHTSFNQGKPVPGCNGARDLSIRLLGIKVSHLQDQKDPPSAKGNALQKWISNPTASSKTLEAVEPVADSKNDSEWKCPICNLQIVADDQTMNEHVDLCLWKSSEEGRRAADEDRQDNESRHDGNPIGSNTKRKKKPDQHMQPSTSASASSSSSKRIKTDVISSHRSSAKKSNKSGSILDWCQRPSGQ